MNSMFELPHPYARYGLAVALLHERIKFDTLMETDAPEILASVIEASLNSFRLTTADDPTNAETQTLRYQYIKFDELKRDASLVQGALAAKGKYLAPNVVSTDGDARGTYDNAVQCLQDLRDGKAFDSSYTLSRSFAPTTAKVNNGKKSQSPPESTLFEAACSIITTLTPIKPAAWAEQPPKYIDRTNTTIIPDLPIDEMRDFVELFRDMTIYALGDLMNVKMPPRSSEQPAAETKKPKRAKQIKEGKAPKSEYKRPPLFSGNYPFAPRHPAFGAVGLLAAIGRWAVEADERERARHVLQSIAGTSQRPGKPLYIVSYEQIQQVQFAHHVVELAIAGELSAIIEGLIYDTHLLGDLGSKRPSVYSSDFETTYRMLHLLASRFLQMWTMSAFQDFFATRVEYSPKLQPLFEVYFMNARKIDKQIVQSARAYGQWLNRSAYFVADAETKPDTPEQRRIKVLKEKAKILVELESAARSAKSALDMLDRVQTRAGRLLQQDAPAEATAFMDATAGGDLDPQDALHLLVAYMRLRSPKAGESDGTSAVADPYSAT